MSFVSEVGMPDSEGRSLEANEDAALVVMVSRLLKKSVRLPGVLSLVTQLTCDASSVDAIRKAPSKSGGRRRGPRLLQQPASSCLRLGPICTKSLRSTKLAFRLLWCRCCAPVEPDSRC